MNQQMLKKWVKELRLKSRKQIQSVLHTSEGFCCLGVACDIFLDDYWKLTDLGINSYEIQGSEMFLPGGLMRDIGLTAEHEHNLMSMNDSGKSFSEIADYIEENWVE